MSVAAAAATAAAAAVLGSGGLMRMCRYGTSASCRNTTNRHECPVEELGCEAGYFGLWRLCVSCGVRVWWDGLMTGRSGRGRARGGKWLNRVNRVSAVGP